MTNGDPASIQGTIIGQPVTEVLESISDAFFALDRDGRFTYLNRAAERLLLRSRDDLLGRSIWAEFPKAVDSRFEREYRRAVAEQVTVAFEEYFPPLETWFEVRAYPTPDGLAVYFQDVNERRRMREELRYSEERHRALFETMTQGVVYQDAAGRIEYANPAANRILGLLGAWREGLTSIGPAWRAVREDGSEFPGVEHPAMVALETGEPVRDVVMGVFAPSAGEFRWISVNASPLFREGAARPHQVYTVFEDITERKRAEDALRAEVAFRRSIESSMMTGIAVVDLEGRLTYVSDSFVEMTGWPRDRLVGRRPPFPFWSPESQDEITAEFRAMIDAAPPVGPFEREVVRADGSRFPALIAVSTLRGPDRRPIGYLAAHLDVTEQKRSEVALRRSEQRYRSLVDATSSIVWTTDSGGLIVAENPSWEAFTGQTPTEYLGWGWLDAIHPFDRDRTAESWNRSLAEKSPYEVEYRILRRDGAYRQVIARGVPVLDADGTLREWVGTCADVTEARRAEEELRRSESLLRGMAHSAPLGVYVVDERTDAILFLNRRFCETWGIRHLEERMRSGELLDADVVPEALRRVADPGAFAEASGRLRDEPGRDEAADEFPLVDGRTIRRFSSRIRDDSGQYFGRLFLFEDVTDQRRAEAMLRQAKEEAERASGAKDEFIAVLSHELRTPLTPVLLTASMMETHPGLPADLREDVASIRRGVELESQLIGDLLDLTRIAKGKLELDLEAVDVHVAIRMAIEICQRAEAVRLVADLSATHHVVRGDSTRLQQVFWNLINNAQKFTGDGGTIVVRTSDAESDQLRVEVVDDGVGIDSAVLTRLFDAFEQGDVRAKRSFAGLGLGLAISKKLVAAHGGTIAASSEGKGRGATFTVELPTVEDATRQVDAPPPHRPSSATGQAMSVLLVEDHDATQRILVRLLGRLGHRVTAASSVASALAACHQLDFDLVLSDLGLPDGSGLDLMRQIQVRYQGRAIALTGYGMEADIRASHEAGFAEHLTKPVDLENLEATIARVLDASPRWGNRSTDGPVHPPAR